ncbi:MAG: hypothetical protein U5J98_02945 [Halobacteriales archaeon]|nr:hypothetical protein [Halobacteriales archaeon]
MTESTDAPADGASAREVVARTDHDGIAVRKVATMHGGDAVAVYFSIRSTRESRCTVRIVDAIPEPLRGQEVEFHPKYDPVNWTRADGDVVYAATIPADSNRTTVYGVVVDDASQLQLFTAEPTVEITDRDPSESTSRSVDTGADFTFDDADDSVDTPDATVREDDPDLQAVEDGSDRGEPPDDEGEDPVESLVDEVRRRELTSAERRALREALGLEATESVHSRLDGLREEVESLRDEATAGDSQAADIDRLEAEIEALSRTLEDRYGSLAASVESLENAVDREARWRAQLQDSLEFDPGGSPDRSRDVERW